jgi:hypothetical protein
LIVPEVASLIIILFHHRPKANVLNHPLSTVGRRNRGVTALFLCLALSIFGCDDDGGQTPEGQGGSGGPGGGIGAGGNAGNAGEGGGAGGDAGEGGGGDTDCVDPGRITMRRLNRIEYDNTIRDLLSDETAPARNFPEDDIGEGFDNVADVLTVSPLHVEKYEAAAKALAESAVQSQVQTIELTFEAEEVGSETGGAFRDEFWNLSSNGEIVMDVVLPSSGQYEIRVRAFGQQAGPDPTRMNIAIDGGLGETVDVVATSDAPEWYTVAINTTAGAHTVRVGFINDYYRPDAEDRNDRDRNLIVDVIVIEGPVGGAVNGIEHVFEAEEVGSDVGGERGDFWNLWSEGTIIVDFGVPAAGEYDLRTRAFGQQAGPDVAMMSLEVDGQLIREFEVAAERGAPAWYEHRMVLSAGQHSMAVSFTNDYYAPDDPDPSNRDRNLHVDVMTITGPIGAVAQPEPGEQILSPIMVCAPQGPDDMDCARQVVSTLARRAWRRPVKDEENDRLMVLVQLARDESDTLEKGIQLAIRGILLAPQFLYRVELDPDPTDTTPHRLSDHELATRLSYFLWSTMPDDQLSERADNGELSDPEVVAAEVERMLADPKARSLVRNFAGQWLYVRAMTDVEPDYNYFPDFDDALRSGMSIETQLYFSRFLSENLPVAQLMTAPLTYINQRLAEHYALDFDSAAEVEGLPFGFRAMDLSGTNRGGLMTLGSILTVTSFPTRTSPVKRGKWVLEQLMCDGPPPPPPGIEAELGEVDGNASLRERLAQHRTNEECAACHDLMDPIGLGLENFDGIGAHRDMIGEFPVDSTGTLPNGTDFDGALELGQLLEDDPRFVQCFQKKLFTYALGRAPNFRDHCHLQAALGQTEATEHPMADMLRQLVHLAPFTQRRGEEVSP